MIGYILHQNHSKPLFPGCPHLPIWGTFIMCLFYPDIRLSTGETMGSKVNKSGSWPYETFILEGDTCCVNHCYIINISITVLEIPWDCNIKQVYVVRDLRQLLGGSNTLSWEINDNITNQKFAIWGIYRGSWNLMKSSKHYLLGL